MNFSIVDFENLDSNSFTNYISSFNTTSWLDHIVASDNNLISDISVHYGQSFFDHIPISFKVHLPFLLERKFIEEPNFNISNLVLWNKLSDDDILFYNFFIQKNLA